MMSAWQYAEMGPFTSSPAAQLASSDTVIFWSASVVATTTQTATPAIAMTIPTTMAVRDAILFIPALRPADRIDRRSSRSLTRLDSTLRGHHGGTPPPARVNARGGPARRAALRARAAGTGGMATL